MTRLDTAISDVDALDRLATRGSPIHRLDPRAKLVVTALFLLTVVSYPKYNVVEMTPLFLYLAALLALGRIPALMLARYLLLACPFALLAGLFNPLIDRQVVTYLGPLAVTGGWLSFVSILIRFTLTVSAVLLLLASTGYVAVCAALGKLGAPRLLIIQFLMLYRFIFILTDEAARMVRAHSLRNPDEPNPPLRAWGSLAGHLLLRAYDRGQRVHTAMLARGFDGTLRLPQGFHWSMADTLFVAGSSGFLLLARYGHLATRIGQWTMELAA
ncbi:MAG TPA: cobalt ECF transporter T component CbiQ [Lentisphaeria bacterium]|jgi:cobalt/nickel transport system permease protein|nr:cobalt ECF transporter T component CbiQ [Lentisphaerota bacterium]HPY90611.1 cobalt ECF transporter T component CbiQ [Lentisphaeria bacterium]HQC52515.1 cobalt ECF transporter T component CbiQ [Lentisphaeria bacterium]HQL86458.1 cobalt ECF transporter T component CbiQ [Lentisphaeria bacterium]